jgi:hypothetical protein
MHTGTFDSSNWSLNQTVNQNCNALTHSRKKCSTVLDCWWRRRNSIHERLQSCRSCMRSFRKFGKMWRRSWRRGMSCVLWRSSCLQPSQAWNRIASLPHLGLLRVLWVLLTAASPHAMKAAAATYTPMVNQLLLFLPFHDLNPHISYTVIGIHLGCPFSTL